MVCCVVERSNLEVYAQEDRHEEDEAKETKIIEKIEN
jgi:hypothetical protein